MVDRFFSKVEKGSESECWSWMGSRNRAGYGAFFQNGRKRQATHVSWEILNKLKFPAGKYACHRCDNPNCVNPHHIFPGSPTDNVQDAIKKGRHKNVPEGFRRLDKKSQTHCIHGHEFTSENTMIKKNDTRFCRECGRIANRKSSKLRRSRMKNEKHQTR